MTTVSTARDTGKDEDKSWERIEDRRVTKNGGEKRVARNERVMRIVSRT